MEDHVELLTVLKELHTISGLRLSVHDTHFHEIAAWPPSLCSFCTELQRNEQALQLCHESDYAAFAKAQATGEIQFYRCRFGLNEAVAPIFSFGSLIGYLMMGQTLCEPEATRDEVWRAARPYAVDPSVLRGKLDDQPLRDPEKILSCIKIMDICAKYISLSNRFNPEKAELAPAIRAYIHQNYSEPLSLERLKNHFFCSRATLINAFRSRYHESINNYITQVRVEKSKELLAYSRRSIKEIAVECGFSNQNYFSKVFLKEIGQTPTDFRRAAHGREEDSDAVEECAFADR